MATQEAALDRVQLLARTALHALDACQRAQQGTAPLDAARLRLLTALAAGAALITNHGPTITQEAAAALCAEILHVYTWFWSALRAVERTAPGTLDQLPGLVTPLSVLRAMALPTHGLTGKPLAQQTVAALVAWLRATGRLGPADWDDGEHPFSIAYYPLGGGGALAILRRDDAVIAYADLSEAGDRVDDLVVLNGQLLPLAGGGRMRLADPRSALARLLARNVAGLGPDQIVGALDVSDEVGTRVLYGPNPEAYLGLVRLTADQVAEELSQSGVHPALDTAPRDSGYESEEEPDSFAPF